MQHIEMAMKGKTNKAFLESIGDQAANGILDSIAKHYGCSRGEILEEVTGEEAHGLCEYMVEPKRSATAALMVLNGFSI